MEESTKSEQAGALDYAAPTGGRYPWLGLALVLPAMAGGMGWGIRGQYGHETGAMVPGVLVALTLVLAGLLSIIFMGFAGLGA